MCIVVIGLMLLLLYYANDQLAELSLSIQAGEQSTVIAQGWEIVVALWPLALLLFLAGVLIVMLMGRVKAMWREMKETRDA